MTSYGEGMLTELEGSKRGVESPVKDPYGQVIGLEEGACKWDVLMSNVGVKVSA